jgi:anti-sigma regulatory factor (Ser/Thr protein kinase)
MTSGAAAGTAPGSAAVRHPGTGDAPVPVLPPRYQGVSMSAQWPLRDYIELGALPGAVPCARLHARQVLWEWRLTGLSDDVELLVSEILTNAVQASRALHPVPPVRLWLLADETRVLILVWDASYPHRGPRRRRKRQGTAPGGHDQHTVGLVHPGRNRRESGLGADRNGMTADMSDLGVTIQSQTVTGLPGPDRGPRAPSNRRGGIYAVTCV